MPDGFVNIQTFVSPYESGWYHPTLIFSGFHTVEITNLLQKAIYASVKAGEAILQVYHTDFTVENKSDDSPLTLADKRSHEIICSVLSSGNIPILSEEGRDIDFSERKKWTRLWVVDPLDGTKEFVKRNDEFTVNIACVEDGSPVLGVIYVPVTGVLYFAGRGLGSYKLTDSAVLKQIGDQSFPEGAQDPASRQVEVPLSVLTDQSDRLPLGRSNASACTIIGSRSHATPELEAYVRQKEKEYASVNFISAGSSLKFCLVAEGMADIYPRLGPTMEWDTAAGQAIAENAGAGVYLFDTATPLAYNKADLLNPHFIVRAAS
jgi:3'(2'), 5'-bisphosphate nucleotidase